MLTEREELAIFKTMSAIETGDVDSPYDTLEVLPDGAGITFGAHQATENSGSLYEILEHYTSKYTDDYTEKIKEYLPDLYDKKDRRKKNRLTNNETFKELLVESAKNSEFMRLSQREVFRKEYFEPALQLCEEYDLVYPLSVLCVYDTCIQSGPGDIESESPRYGAAYHLDKFSRSLPDDAELSEANWISKYVDYRHNWLINFVSNSSQDHTEIVRASAYRTQVLRDLLDEELWYLEMPYAIRINKTQFIIQE